MDSREQLSEKAEAILNGGMQEFLTHGYAATSMDRVAKAAKVSKATVYSHFQDKESLFGALIQRIVQGKFRSIFDPVALEPNPRIMLKALGQRVLQMVVEDPQYLNFIRLILGESKRFPQLAQTFVAKVEQTGFRALTHYLASNPNLHLKDPEVTARVFIGAIAHFVIVQEMLNGKAIVPLENDRFLDGLVDLVIASGEPQILENSD